MSTLERLPYSWRISRYESALRAAGSQWESWTDHSDAGSKFNGLLLTREEYIRVENLYIDALTRFAVDAGAESFTIAWMNHQEEPFALAQGLVLPRSDLAPVARGNLRGELDCALEAPGAVLQIEFGFDLYVHVGARSPCHAAVAEIERNGLFVEYGFPLGLWVN